MFSKTRHNQSVLHRGLPARGLLRDVFSALLLVLVLIIPTMSG
jgi:hypothetical protein